MAPTVADGVVYVGSDDHQVYAGRRHRKRIVELRHRRRGGVRTDGGRRRRGTWVPMTGHVYALDADTGEKLWSYDTGAWVQDSPRSGGGKVYLGSLADGDARVIALDTRSGT